MSWLQQVQPLSFYCKKERDREIFQVAVVVHLKSSLFWDFETPRLVEKQSKKNGLF
jgi:hypothetical protein